MKERPDRPNRPASDSDSDRGLFLERAAKSFQETVTRAGPVALASYTLIGAILALGGIGYGIDLWRGSGHWFLLGGLLLGIIVGFYELAKAVFTK
jgi:F0F1-type ATP synthase assembly protein I